MSIETVVMEQVQSSLTTSIQDGLGNYLKDHLFGYNSPFKPLVNDAVAKMEVVPLILKEAVEELVKEPEFKESLKTSLRKKLVGELVKNFSLERKLKSLRENQEAKQIILDALDAITLLS